MTLDVIETARMVGYKMKESHFDDLNSLHKDPEVAKTMGGIWSDEFVKERLVSYIEHWSDHPFGLWMFYDKNSNTFIGRGGLMQRKIDGENEVEVAFAVLSKFWRKGYGREMGEASVKIGFETLELEQLIAFTLPENLASQALISNLGFTYEKEITYFNLKQKLYRRLSPSML